MGEASCCPLTPSPGPTLLPSPPPQFELPTAPLPKASLMLSQNNLTKQVPCGKENWNPVAISHLSPKAGCHDTCSLAALFSGQRWGAPGPCRWAREWMCLA